MGDLYILAHAVDDHFQISIETFVIINIYKTSSNSKLYVKIGDCPEPNVTISLNEFNFEIVDELPKYATFCTWPVLLRDNYVTSGLCSVARQLVKQSNNETVTQLLGFRQSCLMACSESSIWTKFCEVDMLTAVKSVMHPPTDVLNIPPDFVKFEYHLKQPIRMHNVYKFARELAQKKDIESGIPINELNLHHTFSEGAFMTLSDVILYCCMRIFFKIYPLENFYKQLPLTLDWIKTVEEKIKTIDFSLEFDSNLILNKVCVPDVPKQSLYTSDPARYNPHKRMYTKQKDVANALEIANDIAVMNLVTPYGEEIDFDWSSIPNDLNPLGGSLPDKRADRKCGQLQTLAKAVMKICSTNDQSLTIVDFCSGSGHLGLLLAYLLPSSLVILVENKEVSLERACVRIDKLQLRNVVVLQTNLDYFEGSFDVGVSLHACGVATDLVMENCIKNRAHFVCCPCCYGGIHDCYHLTYPRSVEFFNFNIKDYLTLAHAADQTHDVNNSKTAQGYICMDFIDTDRKKYAESKGYKVFLGKLQPVTCTNKNNLLVGIYRG